ncbi:MAG: transglutaminase family protein [Rhizomicrobium sp.]
MWRDPARIARESEDYKPEVQDALNLVTGIARRLDLNPDCAMEAYEDPWHYIGKERLLPINVDPLDSKLDDPETRARLARCSSGD